MGQLGRVLIVVPCFNCEKQIVRVIDSINKHLVDRIDEVLLVENQSHRDKTLESAFEKINSIESDKFHLIQNNINVGLGGSHKVGIKYAIEHGFDLIAFIHGDHQTDPKELNDLLDEMSKDLDLRACLGARFMRGSRLFGYNWMRKIANRGLNLLYSLVSMKKTYELGAGLSVHRVEDFKDRSFLEFTNDFNFYCFMLLDYYSKKSKLKFFPISYYETDQISNVGNLKIGLLTLKCVLHWRFFGLEKFSFRDKGYQRII